MRLDNVCSTETHRKQSPEPCSKRRLEGRLNSVITCLPRQLFSRTMQRGWFFTRFPPKEKTSRLHHTQTYQSTDATNPGACAQTRAVPRTRPRPAPQEPAHALSSRPAPPARTRRLTELSRTCAKLEADTFFFLPALYPLLLLPLWEGLAGLFLLLRATPGTAVVATIGI